jgi:hypothetical protein
MDHTGESAMRPQDLEHIEHALGIRLPTTYRATMLAYPFPLDSWVTELWLLTDPADVIEENRGASLGWPATHFTIGGDGSGNYYVLDLAREPAPVLEWDHELDLFTELAPDLASWIPVLEQWLAEVEEEERRMAERRRMRKWWQFWR